MSYSIIPFFSIIGLFFGFIIGIFIVSLFGPFLWPTIFLFGTIGAVIGIHLDFR